eukprot:13778504-Alexandrium_andersonii.AAC.1
MAVRGPGLGPGSEGRASPESRPDQASAAFHTSPTAGAFGAHPWPSTTKAERAIGAHPWHSTTHAARAIR